MARWVDDMDQGRTGSESLAEAKGDLLASSW